MVSDAAFYGVLAGLIFMVSLMIIFFFYIKSKMPSRLMANVLTTLHACLFGYESALIELIGPRGYKTHVFPEIVNNMRKMEKSPLIKDLFQSKTTEEALEKWMKILQVSKIVTKGGSVTKDKDGKYIIDIPHCYLCDPIHSIMGQQKGICPMALILTAAGSIADNTKEPAIEYSQFTPTGTITQVKFDEASNTKVETQ